MRYFHIIILLFLFSSLRADQFRIEKIEPENGFPSHLIYKIYQDSKGFIWYGTMYGLYRYDGINYTSYRYDPFDSTSIGNDDVISIFEDSKGFLWFGTYMGGVSRYDASTSSFMHFTHNENKNSLCDNTVWTIAEDKAGAVWFGTQNGLSKYENNSFTSFRDLNGNTQSNAIFSLAADKENNLWIGTFRAGLFRFDPERKKLDNFKRNDSGADSLNGNTVRGLYCDSKGNLWTGMIQRGVCMIKAEDLKKGEYKFNKQLFDSTKQNTPENSTVYEIAEDKKGNIFICSSNNVFEYDTYGKFTKINLSTAAGSKFESVAMICDLSGCLWISSYENCLYKAVRTNEAFSNFSHTSDEKDIGSVKAIYENKEKNNIFIGSDNGLFEFDPVSKKINKLNLKTPFTSVSALIKDNAGNLLVGTETGLVKVSSNKEEVNLLPGIAITKIILSGNSIAVGTSNGLYFINEITNDTIHYTKVEGDNTSLNENLILSLYSDKQNTIWAGTFAGLNRFDADKKSFTHYSKALNDTNSLSNNYIYCIAQKSDDALYLGTAGGLNIFNYKDNKFSLFKDGSLRNTVINSIHPYKNDLWLGTDHELARLSLQNSSVKYYGKAEGIEGNIFNSDAIVLSQTGDIFAGNRTGLVSFSPENLQSDDTKPIITFTGMKLYSAGKNELKDLSRLQKIELNYSQNNLEVNFALMDFNDPGKNQYEYSLQGTDKDWIYSGNKSSVFYSDLNPGNYELKVRGINYNGVRSDERSILLVIHPPFWKTLWFYIMASLLILCLIFLLYKYTLRKNVKLALQLEHAKEEEREKWREQASIDYHDELGHKLTRISMYSRRVLKKLNGSADEFGDDINNIIETSNSLRMSARDLIWSLNPSEDSLFDFITRINLFADELVESSYAQYHKCESKPEWKDIDLSMDTKRQMLFILKEGMNNSIKHSHAKNIWFNVIQNDAKLSFEIVDDGVGFQYPSEYSGYGLLNMQKRAKKAGFDLEISSSESGTKIITYNISYNVQTFKNN